MENFSSSQSLPISAPITPDSAGQHGKLAAQSVVRVICKSTNMGGTGFLHKSGRIITAAHVVDKCKEGSIIIVTSSGIVIPATSVKLDSQLDLALLKPSKNINSPSLPISNKKEILVGTKVTTWGFPSGYNGYTPLLTVGYLSGVDRIPTDRGLSPPRWVVNAAFNSGNSGGPVLSLDDGAVVGVVLSKLAPIPTIIESTLEALSNQKSGFTYTKTLPSGKTETVSEGQVVSEVPKFLRSQVQLVIGLAVTSNDLIDYLKKDDIDP